MGWFGIAVTYWVLCMLVGVWADKKGRNGILGFLLALFLSPLVGALIVAILDDRRLAALAGANGGGSDVRACPYCAEPIRRAAVLCRFCDRRVEALPPAAVASAPAMRRSGALGNAAMLMLLGMLALLALGVTLKSLGVAG